MKDHDKLSIYDLPALNNAISLSTQPLSKSETESYTGVDINSDAETEIENAQYKYLFAVP